MFEVEAMIQFWHNPSLKQRPADNRAALALLNKGNEEYSVLSEAGVHKAELSVEAIGVPEDNSAVLAQQPFAAGLGCSDARVPLEQVFGCMTNDIFTTRVAGNFPGSDTRGSLHYAALHLETIRAFFVLGHTHCGAITATTNSVLDPNGYFGILHDGPLRGIVDALTPAVAMAQTALAKAHGSSIVEHERYRDAVITVATVANAAVSAMVLRRDLDRDVAYGVYDLETRLIGVVGSEVSGLRAAPADMTSFNEVLFAACQAAIS